MGAEGGGRTKALRGQKIKEEGDRGPEATSGTGRGAQVVNGGRHSATSSRERTGSRL